MKKNGKIILLKEKGNQLIRKLVKDWEGLDLHPFVCNSGVSTVKGVRHS